MACTGAGTGGWEVSSLVFTGSATGRVVVSRAGAMFGAAEEGGGAIGGCIGQAVTGCGIASGAGPGCSLTTGGGCRPSMAAMRSAVLETLSSGSRSEIWCVIVIEIGTATADVAGRCARAASALAARDG
jgi:hypothetical protein